MPRNALGRGLSALIREPEAEARQQMPQAPPVPAGVGAGTAVAPALAPPDGFLQVDIDLIDPSPYQPRTRFREEALEELSRSIQATGIVQPLVVRRVGQRFQLIAGERRWRAAQRASLSRVPAVVREVPDELALEMTLVENLQREDLNPMEQARAFQRLTEGFHFTQEQVAERTGKDRATIANSLRLLNLDEQIQELLEDGSITAGHGRALLAVADPVARLELARRAVRGGMSVRQVERFAARGPRTQAVPSASQTDPKTRSALEELQRKFGTKILLHSSAPRKPGQLIFEYYDSSDLARLYDSLMQN